jgi:BioD-like phosphotransacetylase family protein
MVEKYSRIALERMGIPLLGCIPIEKILTAPNLKQIVKEIGGRWLNGRDAGGNDRVKNVIIGAMAAKGIVEFLNPGVLIITPGDREDIILAAIAAEGIAGEKVVSGLILTRNMLPHPRLMDMIVQTRIPVVVCSEDSYIVASKINNMTVKTQPGDDDKIPVIKKLIMDNIDLDVIRHAFDVETISAELT